MSNYSLAMVTALYIFSPAQAQTQKSGGMGENGLLQENLTPFSNAFAEIRKIDGHWELWSGTIKIKNLGNREGDAREVLRLIRAFNLNQRGTVGKPEPVMEYWLSNGLAPQKMGRVNSSVFDPDALQVANVQGQWCLVDENRPWLTFGAQQEDAKQALQIIQKYGFTEIVYFDPLNPAMMVFVAGHDRIAKGPPSLIKPAGSSVNQNPPGKPDNKGPAQWFQPPQLHVNPTFAEQATGRPMIRFDWKQATVQTKGLDWQLVANGIDLAHFGSREPEAREALRAVQTLHLTERCQIGDAVPVFTFYLTNSQPSRNMFFGAKTISCHAKDLTLRQVGVRWVIWEFDHVILALGTNEEEARQVLKVLQHYQVDHLCQIGSTEPAAVTVLVRTH
jgi:hypothetical protein